MTPRRSLRLILLGLPLLGVSQPSASGQRFVDGADIATRAVPPLTTEQVFAQLRRENLPDSERTQLLRSLGKRPDRNNPSVIAALIAEAEYVPPDAYPVLALADGTKLCGHDRPVRVSESSDDEVAKELRLAPASAALVDIGAPAAPQIADEYVFFFENYSLAARDGRSSRLLADATGQPFPEQCPAHRLSLLTAILTQREESSTTAVQYILQRMSERPNDAHLQKAGREFVRGIVSQFSVADQTRLFPTVSPK